MEGFSPQQVQFDTIEILSSFNYSVEVDPTRTQINVTIFTPLTKRHIKLPFDRLSFAQFAKALNDCSEQLRMTVAEEAEKILVDKPETDK